MSDYITTTSDGRDARWWVTEKLDATGRAKRMVSVVHQIRKSQVWRKESFLKYMRLYGNAPLVGFGLSSYARPMTVGGNRVSFNVVKNCSDAFTAKVTKDKPKVSFVTEGGDWDLQEKARSLEKFVEGQIYEMKLYQKAPLAVLDGGGTCGTGLIKFYIESTGKEARIQCERVLPWEIVIDEQEGLYGEPKTLYQEKWIDRLALEEMFPDKAEAIRSAKKGIEAHTGSTQETTSDQVLVLEGWRLPSTKGKKNGRHLIALESADEPDLLDEVWAYDKFPFIYYRRQDSQLGFWGISLAYDLDGIQQELNALLMKIQRAMHLLGAAHVLCESGARVNFSQWDNDQGSKITYTGTKPEVYVPPALVSPEVYEHVDRLYNRAYEITGIPQPQAQGTVPSNLKSGKAQEVYLDVTDQRMVIAIDNYHDMFLEASDWILRLGREIVEKHNEEFGVKAAVGRGTMKKYLLKDIDLTEDEYILKRWPTNALSDDPATRIADVERMSNAGWIAPDEAKRLLGFPDLEEAGNLENASYDAVEDVISEMLNEGRYNPPQPFLNLEQAKRQVQLALIKGWRDRRPDHRLQLLRDWLVDAGELQGGIGAPQPVQTMAGVGGTPVLAPAPGKTPMVGGGPGMAPPPPGPPGVPPGMAA